MFRYTSLGGFIGFIVSYVILKLAGADFDEAKGYLKIPGMGTMGVFSCTVVGACIGIGYDLAQIV